MKKDYIIIGIVAIILVICSIFLFIKKKEEKMEISDVLHLYITYSKGYMANSNIIYSYDYNEKEDKYTVSIKPYLVDDDDKKDVEVTKEFGDKVKEILVKYNVSKWDGFKKYAKDVLDGDGFSFHVRMKDDKTIEADGYMSWPENYNQVIGEFDELFMNIYDEEKGNS